MPKTRSKTYRVSPDHDQAFVIDRSIVRGLMDTPATDEFDRITRLACSVFDASAAIIALFDDNRVWFKSVHGLPLCEVRRGNLFFRQVFSGHGRVRFCDPSEDAALRAEAVAAGLKGMRFFAGIALEGPEGPVGALCIMDRKPRRLSAAKKQVFEDLSRVVVDQIRSHWQTQVIEHDRRVFMEAVEALPDGFVIYDENDRLFTCNSKYRDFYRKSAPAIVRGASFESIIRFGAENGEYVEAVGREEEWVAERIRLHRAANRSCQQQLTDGRWLRITETRTQSGSLVGFRVDITEMKERELQLSELVNRDALTRTLSRRAILGVGEEQWQRASTSGAPLAVIYCDLDHFKNINDCYSHAAGDEFLVAASRVMMQSLRADDHAGRLGGEEFLFVLPDTTLSGAIALGRRICKRIERLKVEFEGETIATTTSIGVAELKTGQSFEDLLNTADQALYQAKSTGRNRVACG